MLMEMVKLVTSVNNQNIWEKYRLMFLWYGIAIVVLLLDLLTKKLASDALFLHERINVMPMFDMTLRHNYGAAFSFLAGAGGWQVWFFGVLAFVVSVGISVWIYKIGQKKSFEVLGLALVLGGALGNLYDRVTLGYVVDFILVYYDPYYFPAFNIADTAITIGAGCLILDHFVADKSQDEAKKDNSSIEVNR